MHIVRVQSDPRAREKPCLRCGLSLRKMLDAKHCPQCGLSVWMSLNQNDALDWSNPPWLKRLTWGAWAMAATQTLAIAAFFIAIIPYRAAEDRYPLAAVLAGGYMVLYHLAMAPLLLHEGRYPDRIRVQRLAARIVAPIGILFGLALLGRGLTWLGSGWPVTRLSPAQALADALEAGLPYQEVTVEMFAQPHWLTAAQVVFAASAVATFALLRPLLRRIPNSFAARLSGYILFAPLLALFKSFPFCVGWLVIQFSWVFKLLPAIYLPVATGILVYFGMACSRSSRHAAEGWAKETSSSALPHSGG